MFKTGLDTIRGVIYFIHWMNLEVLNALELMLLEKKLNYKKHNYKFVGNKTLIDLKSLAK